MPMITLLPRCPERGYVFWDVAQDEFSHDTPLLCRVGVKGLDTFALELSLAPNQWGGEYFFDFAGPGLDHVAELGVMSDGEYQVVASSVVVQSPRRAPTEGATEFVSVVGVTEEGLQTEPTAHEHPHLGAFGARELPYGGSTFRLRRRRSSR